VSTTFGVPATELREDTSPETVPAWDSLNHLTLVMALETEFAIELTADDVLEMRDLGTIRHVLRLRGAEV
jgi:acyl carrier protein